MKPAGIRLRVIASGALLFLIGAIAGIILCRQALFDETNRVTLYMVSGHEEMNSTKYFIKGVSETTPGIYQLDVAQQASLMDGISFIHIEISVISTNISISYCLPPSKNKGWYDGRCQLDTASRNRTFYFYGNLMKNPKRAYEEFPGELPEHIYVLGQFTKKGMSDIKWKVLSYLETN